MAQEPGAPPLQHVEHRLRSGRPAELRREIASFSRRGVAARSSPMARWCMIEWSAEYTECWPSVGWKSGSSDSTSSTSGGKPMSDAGTALM